MELESQVGMIWLSIGVWVLLAVGMLWNNLFRTYTIGVHKWLRDSVLPQLRDNNDWQKEAKELNEDVIPQIDEYISESFGFLLPLVAVLGVNSALVLAAFGGVYLHWMSFLMALGNAACVVGFLELRKRYFVTKSFVEAYKMLVHAEEIHTEHIDDTLE